MSFQLGIFYQQIWLFLHTESLFYPSSLICSRYLQVKAKKHKVPKKEKIQVASSFFVNCHFASTPPINIRPLWSTLMQPLIFRSSKEGQSITGWPDIFSHKTFRRKLQWCWLFGKYSRYKRLMNNETTIKKPISNNHTRFSMIYVYS